MPLELQHKRLDVYKVIRELIKEVYILSFKFPQEEKFNIVQQIKRAAISVKLNLAEGSTRKSKLERKRFFEISRGSVVEIDAALETAIDLNFINASDVESINSLLNRCFAMLSKMIDTLAE